MKGTVKWYNARKGYGFISPEDKSSDVFVHAVALKNCGLSKLYTGSEVTFEVDQDEKGKRAKNLKVTKEVRLETESKKGKPDFKKETKKVKPKTESKKGKPDFKKETKKVKPKTESKKKEKSNKKTKSK